MSNAEFSVLRALVSPGSVNDFLTRYWPNEVFVSHGDLTRLPPVFHADVLSSFENLAAHYRGDLRFTHGRKCIKMIEIDRVNPNLLYEMGLTLQFKDIAPVVSGATEFLRQLEQELGINEGAASISAFASPSTDGLSCHYDAQDLISIQLIGSKKFHIAPVREIKNPYGTQYVSGTAAYPELYPQALNGFPDPENSDFRVVEMRPGTVLYLPRGTWHFTEAKEPSLSISIIINPITAAECLLEQLRYLLLQDEDWRRPLYGASRNDGMYGAAKSAAEALLEKLPAAVARLRASDLLTVMQSYSRRLQSIDAHSRFQKRPDAQIVFLSSRSGGVTAAEVRLNQPGTEPRPTVRMQVYDGTIPLLQWLDHQRRPFCMADVQDAFPEIPADELRKILLAVERAQLVKLLWFASLREPQKRRAPPAAHH